MVLELNVAQSEEVDRFPFLHLFSLLFVFCLVFAEVTNNIFLFNLSAEFADVILEREAYVNVYST